LDVTFNLLNTLNPIFNCTTLTSVAAGNNTLESLAGLEKLTALEILNVSHNTLTDVSPIASCLAIRELDISENQVEDISSFSVLTKMESLLFSRNSVKVLPEFAKDCALITIDGSHNKIEKLNSLKGLENLNNVFMDYNEKLSSIKPLTSCTRLVQVKVYGTKVKDVSALLEMDIVVEFDPTLAM